MHADEDYSEWSEDYPEGVDEKLIESKTGIATRVADDAISCVAYGTGKSLENLDVMQDGTISSSSRRRQLL